MKISPIFKCVVMMFATCSIVSMDKPNQSQQGIVTFYWKDKSSVEVKKSHLPLMKTLESLYKSSCKTNSVELFSYVRQHHCAQGLSVVEDALDVIENVGADFKKNKESYMEGSLENEFKFKHIAIAFQKHYTELLPDQQNLLIKLSGQYSGQTVQVGDKAIAIPMLNIPELTKHLIEVCFGDNHVRNWLKSYFNDDRAVVRNYFKERLILSKRSLLPLQESVGGQHRLLVANSIHPQSLFVNGYRTDHGVEYPVRLFIGDEHYETYGYSFFTDDYECRVTESIDNQPSDPSKKQYCLWGIDHKNGSSKCLAFIEHSDPIKGVCFSKTKKNVEYIVTYSDFDMVFSQIVVDEEGVSFVESVSVVSPNAGTIIGMCFNYDYDDNHPVMRVGTHEGVNSVSRYWDMQGKRKAEGSFPFKDYGALDQIFASRRDSGNIHHLVFSSGEEYDIYKFGDLGNPYGGICYFKTGLYSAKDLCRLGRVCTQLGRSCFVSESLSSPFAVMVQADQKSKTNSLFKNIVDSCTYFGPDPDNESFKVYSPDGIMLLSIMLKKKLGILYVETTLKDALTHIPIISVDTLYGGFVGVGFSLDSSSLIFLHYNRNNKVSLLDDADKVMLKEAENLMFNNVGTVALLKQLCMECKQNKIVRVVKDRDNHKMLMGWAKTSPSLLEFMKKCLPIEVIKAQ